MWLPAHMIRHTMTHQVLRIAFVDYVVDPKHPGLTGLSDVVWDMASELINQGHEVHIVASYHTQHYPDPRVIVHNFPTPPIGYRNIVGHLMILGRAAVYLRQINPDIIHAPEYVSTAVFATLGLKAPLVLTVPGNIYQRIRQGHGYDWHFVQVLKWAARTSARHCASVIAISQEMKYWWERTGSAPERTPWIPYGVSPARFSPQSGARAHLHIADSAQLLLYVGRFSREKGLLDLLDAVSQIRDRISGWAPRIVLVGGGPQEAEIRGRVQALELEPIVQMRGWVLQDELKWWYSAADALLMPSWNEPLGRVMLEAMLCGTPVIASATEGPNDHIRDSATGFLFPPHNVEQLAGILEHVATHREVLRNMRRATLEYASERLIWPKIVERIVQEVYEPIVCQSMHMTI